MTDVVETAVTRALEPYAHELRVMHPSTELDARVAASIEAWARENSARKQRRLPLPWVAAASIAVVAGMVALLMHRNGLHSVSTMRVAASSEPDASQLVSEAPTARQADGVEVSELAAGQTSLWPAESAIFRVKTSLASTGGFAAAGERHKHDYWVDVRIANDGTMRIMQVLPADRGHATPLKRH